jgi:hypothetical protein
LSIAGVFEDFSVCVKQESPYVSARYVRSFID